MKDRMKLFGLVTLFFLATFTLSAQTIGVYKTPNRLSSNAIVKAPKYQKRVIVLLDKKGERIDGILPILNTSAELKKKYPKNRFFIGFLKTSQKLSRNTTTKGDHIVLFTDTEFFPGDMFVVVENGFFPGDNFFPGDHFRKLGIRSVEILKKEEREVQLLLR